MKKVLIGIIIGIFIGATGIANAENINQWVAIRATFPIIVNGNQLQSDKPIVAIEGSTYAPLKTIGDALGVEVRWNGELSRVEIGQEPRQDFEFTNIIVSYQPTGFSKVEGEIKNNTDKKMVMFKVSFYKDGKLQGTANGAINIGQGETKTFTALGKGNFTDCEYKIQIDLVK